VLEGLRPGQNGRVLPVVGSVVSNRRWLEEHFAPKAAPSAGRHATPGHGAPGHAVPGGKPAIELRAPIPGPAPAHPAQPARGKEIDLGVDGDWGNLFDAGDEAVQLGLNKKPRQ
jgi:hypothetical protein